MDNTNKGSKTDKKPTHLSLHIKIPIEDLKDKSKSKSIHKIKEKVLNLSSCSITKRKKHKKDKKYKERLSKSNIIMPMPIKEEICDEESGNGDNQNTNNQEETYSNFLQGLNRDESEIHSENINDSVLPGNVNFIDNFVTKRKFKHGVPVNDAESEAFYNNNDKNVLLIDSNAENIENGKGCNPEFPQLNNDNLKQEIFFSSPASVKSDGNKEILKKSKKKKRNGDRELSESFLERFDELDLVGNEGNQIKDGIDNNLNVNCDLKGADNDVFENLTLDTFTLTECMKSLSPFYESRFLKEVSDTVLNNFDEFGQKENTPKKFNEKNDNVLGSERFESDDLKFREDIGDYKKIKKKSKKEKNKRHKTFCNGENRVEDVDLLEDEVCRDNVEQIEENEGIIGDFHKKHKMKNQEKTSKLNEQLEWNKECREDEAGIYLKKKHKSKKHREEIRELVENEESVKKKISICDEINVEGTSLKDNNQSITTQKQAELVRSPKQNDQNEKNEIKINESFEENETVILPQISELEENELQRKHKKKKKKERRSNESSEDMLHTTLAKENKEHARIEIKINESFEDNEVVKNELQTKRKKQKKRERKLNEETNEDAFELQRENEVEYQKIEVKINESFEESPTAILPQINDSECIANKAKRRNSSDTNEDITNLLEKNQKDVESSFKEATKVTESTNSNTIKSKKKKNKEKESNESTENMLHTTLAKQNKEHAKMEMKVNESFEDNEVVENELRKKKKHKKKERILNEGLQRETVKSPTPNDEEDQKIEVKLNESFEGSETKILPQINDPEHRDNKGERRNSSETKEDITNLLEKNQDEEKLEMIINELYKEITKESDENESRKKRKERKKKRDKENRQECSASSQSSDDIFQTQQEAIETLEKISENKIENLNHVNEESEIQRQREKHKKKKGKENEEGRNVSPASSVDVFQIEEMENLSKPSNDINDRRDFSLNYREINEESVKNKDSKYVSSPLTDSSDSSKSLHKQLKKKRKLNDSISKNDQIEAPNINTEKVAEFLEKIAETNQQNVESSFKESPKVAESKNPNTIKSNVSINNYLQNMRKSFEENDETTKLLHVNESDKNEESEIRRQRKKKGKKNEEGRNISPASSVDVFQIEEEMENLGKPSKVNVMSSKTDSSDDSSTSYKQLKKKRKLVDSISKNDQVESPDINTENTAKYLEKIAESNQKNPELSFEEPTKLTESTNTNTTKSNDSINNFSQKMQSVNSIFDKIKIGNRVKRIQAILDKENVKKAPKPKKYNAITDTSNVLMQKNAIVNNLEENISENPEEIDIEPEIKEESPPTNNESNIQVVRDIQDDLLANLNFDDIVMEIDREITYENEQKKLKKLEKREESASDEKIPKKSKITSFFEVDDSKNKKIGKSVNLQNDKEKGAKKTKATKTNSKKKMTLDDFVKIGNDINAADVNDDLEQFRDILDFSKDYKGNTVTTLKKTPEGHQKKCSSKVTKQRGTLQSDDNCNASLSLNDYGKQLNKLDEFEDVNLNDSTTTKSNIPEENVSESFKTSPKTKMIVNKDGKIALVRTNAHETHRTFKEIEKRVNDEDEESKETTKEKQKKTQKVNGRRKSNQKTIAEAIQIEEINKKIEEIVALSDENDMKINENVSITKASKGPTKSPDKNVKNTSKMMKQNGKYEGISKSLEINEELSKKKRTKDEAQLSDGEVNTGKIVKKSKLREEINDKIKEVIPEETNKKPSSVSQNSTESNNEEFPDIREEGIAMLEMNEDLSPNLEQTSVNETPPERSTNELSKMAKNKTKKERKKKIKDKTDEEKDFKSKEFISSTDASDDENTVNDSQIIEKEKIPVHGTPLKFTVKKSKKKTKQRLFYDSDTSNQNDTTLKNINTLQDTSHDTNTSPEKDSATEPSGGANSKLTVDTVFSQTSDDGNSATETSEVCNETLKELDKKGEKSTGDVDSQTSDGDDDRNSSKDTKKSKIINRNSKINLSKDKELKTKTKKTKLTKKTKSKSPNKSIMRAIIDRLRAENPDDFDDKDDENKTELPAKNAVEIKKSISSDPPKDKQQTILKYFDRVLTERYNYDTSTKSNKENLSSLSEFETDANNDSDEVEEQVILQTKQRIKDIMSMENEAMLEIMEKNEKLSKLEIQIDWKVPLLHKIETRVTSVPTKEQAAVFKELNLKVKMGPFTKTEDDTIKNNFQEFCKVHSLDHDPVPFLKFRYHKGELLKTRERINFVRFLGKGLNDRKLWRIYQRFKILFGEMRGGRFTEEEDLVIENYLKIMKDDPKKYSSLSKILKRPRLAIEKHAAVLQLHKDANRLRYRDYEKIIRSIMKVMNVKTCEELKTKEILDKHWTKISKKTNVKKDKLMMFWDASLQTKLFHDGPIKADEILKKVLDVLDEREENDYRNVNWSQLAKLFENISRGFLYRLFKRSMYHVPVDTRSHLRRSVLYLKKLYKEQGRLFDDIPNFVLDKK